MSVKVVIIKQNDLSSTSLPEPFEVVWDDFTPSSFMKFEMKEAFPTCSDYNEDQYIANTGNALVSKKTGTVAILVLDQGKMRVTPFDLRPAILTSWCSRPASILPNDKLWMVNYQTTNCEDGGVYAWAYDKEDATIIARTLLQYPEQFKSIGISLFSKNEDNPAGPDFPFETFIRSKESCNWCIQGITVGTSVVKTLAYIPTEDDAQRLIKIFKAYPEFYSELSYSLIESNQQ